MAPNAETLLLFTTTRLFAFAFLITSWLLCFIKSRAFVVLSLLTLFFSFCRTIGHDDEVLVRGPRELVYELWRAGLQALKGWILERRDNAEIERLRKKVGKLKEGIEGLRRDREEVTTLWDREIKGRSDEVAKLQSEIDNLKNHPRVAQKVNKWAQEKEQERRLPHDLQAQIDKLENHLKVAQNVIRWAQTMGMQITLEKIGLQEQVEELRGETR
jgi:hypothetical protein